MITPIKYKSFDYIAAPQNEIPNRTSIWLCEESSKPLGEAEVMDRKFLDPQKV